MHEYSYKEWILYKKMLGKETIKRFIYPSDSKKTYEKLLWCVDYFKNKFEKNKNKKYLLSTIEIYERWINVLFFLPADQLLLHMNDGCRWIETAVKFRYQLGR